MNPTIKIKICTTLAACLLFFQTFSQSKSTFFIEANLVEYGPKFSHQDNTFYGNAFSFYNGLNIGYSWDKQNAFYLGADRVHDAFKSGLFGVTDWKQKGFDLNLGYERRTFPNQLFHFSYTIELRYSSSLVTGTYSPDYPGTSYEYNHRLQSAGLGIGIKVHCQVHPRIHILCGPKLRYEYRESSPLQNTRPGYAIRGGYNQWEGYLDLIDCLGIRIYLSNPG